MEDLRGKVVLIDFWTYTCVNCIRTMPYLREWHDKYAKEGLVIVGVHAPEFEFEKLTENVEASVEEFDLPYPTRWVPGEPIPIGPGRRITWWAKTVSFATSTLAKGLIRKPNVRSAMR